VRNTLRIFLSMIILCTATFSWGQKVKYKDLFFLIHKSKKYADGEPFLRSFLSNPKNADHPDANFQMGVIHEVNAKTKDVLKENQMKVALLDSAVYFYSKSKSLITEKWIKRNGEYYEDDFLRRDLRTGKMGIKVSDVHLDIDERVDKINDHIANLKSIDTHFSKAKEEYQLAFDAYTELVSKYESQKSFYLRADDEVIKQCDQILASYDSAMGNFANYKLRIANVGESDYNQSLNVLKIEDIKNAGDKTADFYAASVDVYDFSDWVNRTKTVLIDKIKPIKAKLLTYDQRLDRTREQLMKDSVSVISKLELEKDDALYQDLRVYDKNAMPLNLLDLKQEELRYWSFIFANKPNKDSLNINYQIAMASDELNAITAVDSLANALLGYNLTVEFENYKEYIKEQYEGVAGVQRHIKQKLDFAQAEKKYRATILEAKQERSKWLLYGNDSIPLFEMDTTQQLTNNGKTQYVNLGGSPTDNPIQFIHGMKYDPKGSTAAYISVVPDSLRVLDITTYDMDTTSFSLSKIGDLGIQQVQEEVLNLTYVLYYDNSTYQEAEKKAQLTCINGSGTVLWSSPLNLVYPPDRMTLYDQGGVSINYDVKFINTDGTDKLVSRLLVGTDGKVLN